MIWLLEIIYPIRLFGVDVVYCVVWLQIGAVELYATNVRKPLPVLSLAKRTYLELSKHDVHTTVFQLIVDY